MVVQKPLDNAHVVHRPHERNGDIIHFLFDTELYIRTIDVGKVRHVDERIGHIDTLSVGEHSVVENGRNDVGSVYAVDFKLDKPVVDEYARALAHILRKILVRNGNATVIAHDVARRKYELLALFELRPAVLERLDAYFGTFGVEKNGDGYAKLFSGALDHIHAPFVFFVSAVRKIHSRDVHARADHAFYDGIVVGRGTERANYFCFTHKLHYLFYTLNEHCAFVGLDLLRIRHEKRRLLAVKLHAVLRVLLHDLYKEDRKSVV